MSNASSFRTKRGPQGVGAYVYVAYASDDAGADFTTTFDAALHYIAVLATNEPIPTPQVGDFAGLWKNYKGETGPQGATGEKGSTGEQGPQGDQGPQGATGAQGAQGPSGDVGTQGPAGPQGDHGDFIYVAYASDASGTDFTLTFDAALNYIAFKRSATAIGSPGAGDFAGLWKNYKGATGPQGAQGATGATGSQGAQGAQGETGADGPQGATGADGSSVLNGSGPPDSGLGANGDYYLDSATGAFYEKQSGTWQQVFNLTGQQGPQGTQGDPGQHAAPVEAIAGENFAAGDIIFQDHEAAVDANRRWWKVDADAYSPVMASRRIGVATAQGISGTADVVPTMTGETDPEGEAFASSERSGEEAWRAFDKNSSSKWRTNGEVAAWLRILLAASRTVAEYRITADTVANAPADWTFQGSNNGFQWTTLDTQTGQAFSAGETKVFTVSSPQDFYYYRLNITDNGGNANTAVKALTLHTTGVNGAVQCEPTPIDYGAGGLTVGEPVYAAATAGAITQDPANAGVPKRMLGVAISASQWHFLPWLALATPYSFTVAASDETTSLTTGTAKLTFRAECDFRLDEVVLGLSTASSSGAVDVDVKKNGTSIFTTRPTVDASEKTSATAATPAVLATRTVAKGDEITVDIVGAGTGAAGLKLTFNGER